MADGPFAVSFVPSNIALQDARRFSSMQAQQLATAVRASIGFDSLTNGTVAYMQQLWTRGWNSRHPEFNGNAAARAEAETQLHGLQDILLAALGQKLGSDEDNNVTLFNMPVGEAQLSEGQRILLQFCVVLHAQGGRLDECILFLDEPEKHLHPAALLDILTQLQRLVTKGQVWIATHSVHVLAHVDPGSIWYMDAGKVEHAGRAPEKVLRGLVGDDDQVARLAGFLGEPARLAMTRFALECLVPPATVSTTADAQSTQVTRILLQDFGTNRRCVLDYGAGRGRLLAALRERYAPAPEHLVLDKALDYIAFDPHRGDRDECEQVIQSVYESSAGRWFSELHDLRTLRGDHLVDVAVMCNVLHEVDPREWPALFDDATGLGDILKQDGSLLIVEDQRMPVGENAHSKGFLVLDTIALRKLFSAEAADIGRYDERGDSRLLAHSVPARLIGRVTQRTIRAAITSVRDTARAQIQKVRRGTTEAPTFSRGLAHAFWTHQLANAELALFEMGATSDGT